MGQAYIWTFWHAYVFNYFLKGEDLPIELKAACNSNLDKKRQQKDPIELQRNKCKCNSSLSTCDIFDLILAEDDACHFGNKSGLLFNIFEMIKKGSVIPHIRSRWSEDGARNDAPFTRTLQCTDLYGNFN